MRSYLTSFCLLLAALCVPAAPLRAATAPETGAGASALSATGTVGCAAPAIEVEEWITSSALTASAWTTTSTRPGLVPAGRACVIVFWGAWSQACVASWIRLKQIQEQNPDVAFLAISEDPANVQREFLTIQDKPTSIAMAKDKAHNTRSAYMDAFRVITIPHAFLVDTNARIVWHGQPEMGLGKAIAQVRDGTYDMSAVAKADAVRDLVRDYAVLVTKTKDAVKGRQLGLKIVSDGAANPMLLDELAGLIIGNKRVAIRDLDLALLAARKAYEVAEVKTNHLANRLYRALLVTGRRDEARSFAQQALVLCHHPGLRVELEALLKETEAEVTSGTLKKQPQPPPQAPGTWTVKSY